MKTWVTVVIIVVALLVIAALVLAAMRASRRRKARTAELKDRFGPEYDRLASDGSQKKAERELAERERRHAQLDIRSLPEADRTRFAQSWQDVQLSFLDSPTTAVREAESLVGKVMSARGYPDEADFSAMASELSVEHARQLDNLRAAHAVSEASSDGKATTEDLRQAMVRYRALFADLLRAASDGPSAYPAEPAEQRVDVTPS
jgi:FtsZ-interacting cell division protein ZipA